MSDNFLKSAFGPALSVTEQIEHLEKKGVVFDYVSVEEAKRYLTDNNNYFKLRSYRKNFRKHPDGANEGKYIGLDFGCLKDLAIIDMRLRYTLLHLALDIEHYAKIRLINFIIAAGEDGYSIVSNYIKMLKAPCEKDQNRYKRFEDELKRNLESPYCNSLAPKIQRNCYPVWVLLEIISFGRFVDFYGFCKGYFNSDSLKDDFYLLRTCRTLRNAAAHNSCIINDLVSRDSLHKTNFSVSTALSKISGVTKQIRKDKMQNIRIQQIVTLLYSHHIFVSSQGVKIKRCDDLNELVERMHRNLDFYKFSPSVSTTFNFFKKIVDNWFCSAYTKTT